MRKPQKEIQLTSYNELLGIDDSVNPGTDRIVEIPISDLHPFKGHPFKVLDDEKMTETAESIRNYGVLNPGLVRPRAEGGYEVVAGHRRNVAVNWRERIQCLFLSVIIQMMKRSSSW